MDLRELELMAILTEYEALFDELSLIDRLVHAVFPPREHDTGSTKNLLPIFRSVARQALSSHLDSVLKYRAVYLADAFVQA